MEMEIGDVRIPLLPVAILVFTECPTHALYEEPPQRSGLKTSQVSIVPAHSTTYPHTIRNFGHLSLSTHRLCLTRNVTFRM